MLTRTKKHLALTLALGLSVALATPEADALKLGKLIKKVVAPLVLGSFLVRANLSASLLGGGIGGGMGGMFSSPPLSSFSSWNPAINQLNMSMWGGGGMWNGMNNPYGGNMSMNNMNPWGAPYLAQGQYGYPNMYSNGTPPPPMTPPPNQFGSALPYTTTPTNYNNMAGAGGAFPSTGGMSNLSMGIPTNGSYLPGTTGGNYYPTAHTGYGQRTRY